MNPIEKIEQHSVYELATIADCGKPDSKVSLGSDFLASVRDDVLDKVNDYWDGKPSTLEDVILAQRERIQDEVSDSAPSVYTHTMWTEYVDLCAYQEDLSEFGTPTDDTMEGRARLALSAIGFRLASALLDEIEEASK
ncbi:hypothetical protein PQC18_gp68 [Streptomyces phage Pablito]|uniref:Uncharacterized protein n=1 Tax=Streptomyces phage Pablito TaxID=2894593 RepID=A0AAE8YFA2_9CAUD|nr:hypothetical protein PQC18_gp68 [Streptomyces phage Pablito]UFD98006.1 hypothetical protein [Streptomyces phage Pablito]